MTTKNRKLKSALLAFVGVLVTALSVWGGTSNRAGVAIASAPTGNTGPNAPLTDWTTPDLLSWVGEYDNYSGIAASDIDGSITVDWGAAPDDSTGTVYVATNNGLGQQTDIQDLDSNSPNLVNCKNQFGPCPITTDALGRRHLLYWNYEPNWCMHYVIINPGGAVIHNEVVPGSCDNNIPRKLLAIAVDNNLTVHIVGSRDNMAVTTYWQKLVSGSWSVVNEYISQACGFSGDLTLTVSTLGTVMAAFKDCGVSGTGTDIWTATRVGANQWDLDDISASCCSSCPNSSNAYLANLAAAPDGGIRISWSDGRCPGNENIKPDIYYREWVPGTGWDGQPIVRVAQNSGTSYHNALTVDASGEAHIVWADDTSSPFAYFRTFYAHGRGTTFTGVELPFDRWAPNSWQRDVAIDAAFGHVHVAVSTVRTDPQKDVYYSYAATGALPPPTPTATATSTPTPPCLGDDDLDFQDVCEGSTFFDYIRTVFEAGVISGYACGSPGEQCVPPDNLPYYRPNNSTNRGQMSKIVVLGAELPLVPAGPPSFQDVPSGHTFFQYVETAFANGVIGGYACGGPGEPCVPPDNKPYYRPGSNVTRGQLTKMVSVAFNFTEPVSGQSFEDVGPNNPFYEYVQRLFTRGLISGYPCGGVGEPCVPPDNRPYFRTGNSITRGQTAKVVAGAMNEPEATPTVTSTPQPPPACVPLQIAYGVTNSGNLVSFDVALPGVLLSNDTVTGLEDGETIEGIDFRPTTEVLFALGSTSRLYTIDPLTAAATQVGAAGAFTVTGTEFGFDFNPVVDRIRVVSNDEQNMRLNPDDGTLTGDDVSLAYATADPNEGQDPFVLGAGYTNSYSGTGSTTLYDIDTDLNILALQTPPNNGTLSTVGALGIDPVALGGFDIRACDNTAYAALALAPLGNGAVSSNLYTVDLTSGAVTLVDTIGPGNVEVSALALAPSSLNPEPTATPAATATATATTTPQARTNR